MYHALKDIRQEVSKHYISSIKFSFFIFKARKKISMKLIQIFYIELILEKYKLKDE